MRLAASARSSTSRSPNGCSSNPCPTGSPGSAVLRSPPYGISLPRPPSPGGLDRPTALMLPAEPFRPKRAAWLQAGAVALALFALYAATAPHTVALEDDGLFILSSYFLGIEHPPGYPLFTLIGHLFTYLPFGAVAYRVHLASALFGALTGGAAWLCARALIGGRLPAYLAAFALGVSPVFWSQAIIAEVYTLNTFFFLALVFMGLQACPPSTLAPPSPAANPVASRMLPWTAL